MESDYLNYRGKCREFSEQLCVENPEFKLIRGYYHCPFWGKQPHWWCVDNNGTIIDPTKSQFPSKGIGEYEEFDGIVSCSNCGKEGKEEDFEYESNYAFCSASCHLRFVGL